MSQENLNFKKASYTINSIGIQELEDCIRLDQIAMHGFWTKDQWRKELANSQNICRGVFKESELIAFACGWIVIDELNLTSIAVNPKHRKKGIGVWLLMDLIKRAKSKGAIKAILEVKSSNHKAIALYTKCGFINSGCRHNYYKDGSDALIHWKDLKVKEL